MVKQLEEAGILTQLEGHTLARYCQLWAKWRELSEVDTSKIKVESVDDLKLIMQTTDKMIKLSDALLKIEAQFGLTPATRANVKRTQAPTGDDSKSRFFEVHSGKKAN